MSIRIVRLEESEPGDRLRLGTVRRPPRGVAKARLSDWYDVWVPQLAPSQELVKEAQSAETPAQWNTFIRKYRKEMSEPDNDRLLGLLAMLSHRTDLAVGCYCAEESHCHRSVLRELLAEHGAEIE
jgi:uncharacterized protein YeaO (DUF488 family)